MARSMNLGMPRIGPDRELKWATEAYWAGRSGEAELHAAARARRLANWQAQAAAGIEEIPSGDFSLYDQVLDACCMLGALPERFGTGEAPVGLDTYFAMARGADVDGRPVAAMEMTKWFDTNYHYLVPELGPASRFSPAPGKVVGELLEAAEIGIRTRPVLVGPVSFLLLAKPTQAGFSTLKLLPELLAAYAEVLAELADAGAEWVQLDEPCLVGDLSEEARRCLVEAYAALSGASQARLLVASYFGGLEDNLPLAAGLPVGGLHVDLVSDPAQLPALLGHLGPEQVLSVGAVDGRNVWRSDLRTTLGTLTEAHERLGDRLWVGPSCSLVHLPHDVGRETALDPELRGWLSFALQKLDEVAVLARGLSEGPAAVAEALAESDAAASQRSSGRLRSEAVRRRVAALGPGDATRAVSLAARREAQGQRLPLPALPTTTIGSFPQTAEIRRARRDHAAGRSSAEEYRRFCEAEIGRAIRDQEALGLDVLVHGEPERNDMVQYFAEHLDGFLCTSSGWVQSYGTRCVRPPILYADVARPGPITVGWARHAQSLTARPVKGMLTGPVTMLQWSFVRDDQPRQDTARQIALAMRDEVADLEAAGIAIIQVDEPALREGLPLRWGRRESYLAWATECFRLTTSGVADTTQIHTHMCYGDFGDIAAAIASLDADVLSFEAARSGPGTLEEISASGYTGSIGPGVYDVHSPRVPSEEEIAGLIREALEAGVEGGIWVNPDCGLKTRRWEEVRPALANMVAAARAARGELA